MTVKDEEFKKQTAVVLDIAQTCQQGGRERTKNLKDQCTLENTVDPRLTTSRPPISS